METTTTRTVLRNEVLLVLAVSLGASAVYSVVSIVARLTARTALADQTATLNASVSDRPLLDLTYQLLGILFALVPAVLALHLLGRTDGPALRAVGLDTSRPLFDLSRGAVLAAVIGIPGLGLYVVSHALGLNATVIPAALPHGVWWGIPVLVLSAVQNSLLEEIVVVGYLLRRLEQLGVPGWGGVVLSAALRASYHLYQGFGGFVGNFVMGLVFGAAYRRWGRLGPLVAAHAILDVVAFVGYALLRGKVTWLP
jgi:membrane protease YdiL (CAAX protease family)